MLDSELFTHLHYWLAATLFLIGLYGMLANRNFVRKLMAMNVLQVAVIIFFISLAGKTGGTAPIALPDHGELLAADYFNPLPHALMLTAIVVSVSTTGVALALLLRIHRRYRTLDERELLDRMNG
jgi:multicomponent Na+:H+ antiporter subunit C